MTAAGRLPVSANRSMTRKVERNRAPGGRNWVVGDIHGCFRTLSQALHAIDFAASSSGVRNRAMTESTAPCRRSRNDCEAAQCKREERIRASWSAGVRKLGTRRAWMVPGRRGEYRRRRTGPIPEPGVRSGGSVAACSQTLAGEHRVRRSRRAAGPPRRRRWKHRHGGSTEPSGRPENEGTRTAARGHRCAAARRGSRYCTGSCVRHAQQQIGADPRLQP